MGTTWWISWITFFGYFVYITTNYVEKSKKFVTNYATFKKCKSHIKRYKSASIKTGSAPSL